MKTKKPKYWVVAASTIAMLAAGGYKLTDWNEETGWGIVDTTEAVAPAIDTNANNDTIIIARKPIPKKREDTLRFADSTQLAEFGQFGKHGFGGNAVFK